MKKLFRVMLCVCMTVLLIVGMNIPAETVNALTPPPPVPDYYYVDYNSVDEFIQWIKNPESKSNIDGAFNEMITEYENFGYILVPRYTDNTNVSVSTFAGGLWRPKYVYYRTPKYSVKTRLLDNEYDRKYASLGIVQYIKDKAKIDNFDKEVSGIYPMGMDREVYAFTAEKYNIGGNDKEVVLYQKTSIDQYTNAEKSCSYGVVFIEKSMIVDIGMHSNVTYDDVEKSLKNLVMTEVVLNKENKEKLEDAVADSVKLRIKGKTKLKVNKSYKYKVKCTGVKGKVKWSVNKKKLAKITKNGKLKALKKGTVKLTATVKGVKSTIKIKIVS